MVETRASTANTFNFLYPDDLPLWEKVRTIAQKIYGANDIMADNKLRAKFKDLEEAGFGQLPVCMAKTQYSFSTDPALRGRPDRLRRGHPRRQGLAPAPASSSC